MTTPAENAAHYFVCLDCDNRFYGPARCTTCGGTRLADGAGTSPAENAATVREALSLLLDVPDNAETHEAALNGSAALDALLAQAEAAGLELQVANQEHELCVAAEAERDAAVRAAEQAREALLLWRDAHPAHRHECGVVQRCTCGLEAARKATRAALTGETAS